MLRVKLPDVGDNKSLLIGVKSRHFDDCYSNVVVYNGIGI